MMIFVMNPNYSVTLMRTCCRLRQGRVDDGQESKSTLELARDSILHAG